MNRRTSLLLVILAAAGIGQTPLYTFRGETNNTFVGEAVASPGDLNNDGVADILVGQSGFDGAAGFDTGRVTAISGADGSVLYRVEGPNFGDWFGASLAGLGDLDADGTNDWIGGAPYFGPNGSNAGSVHVVSGATGTIIRSHLGAPDVSGDGFGASYGYMVNRCEDVNGDTIPDYLIGAPGDYFSGVSCSLVDQGGSVEIRSGLNGSLIHLITGVPICGNAGACGVGLVDLNGDGRGEFLLGYPGSTGIFGRIDLHDGLTGAVLRTHPGLASGDFFGEWVAALGDLDGDGTPDYGGSSENYDPILGVSGPGYVLAFSGANGLPLFQYNGNVAGDAFGRGFGNASDCNGDGVPDLFAAAPFDSTNGLDAGRVAIVDGSNGATLFEVFGEAPGDFIGFNDRCAVVPDLDGDGSVEIIASTWANDAYGNNRGIATVHSSQSRSHWLSQNLISIANPGLVEFEIQGPPNGIYVALGSLSGTTPPTMIGNFTIPLVNDAWFSLCLDANTTPFTDAVGLLDANGQGRASLNVPAGLDPALSGLRHYSVAVVIDTVASTLTISQPEAFTLTN